MFIAALSRRMPLVVFFLVLGAQTASLRAEPAPVETTLQSRNSSVLEVAGVSARLKIVVRSITTARELKGEISFSLEGDEDLPPVDHFTCTPSMTFKCGVVVRFTSARTRPGPPTVLEADLEDGTLKISDPRAFETFVKGLIHDDSAAIKIRVDQKQDLLFDLRRLSWPLAAFDPQHPFAKRFGEDPVLAALKARYPARYLKIMTLAREESPQSGTLPPDAERKILEAMHATVGSLRPMVPDELLEKIVFQASAAAKAVGSRDLALCNALAVAARSAVTVPELKDTELARQEYALWQQVVEQAHPRFIRRVPNEDLLPSTARFEDNVRIANQEGCGMFAAVIDGILKLPREDRRLWLRATVGTVEDLRAAAADPPRQ